MSQELKSFLSFCCMLALASLGLFVVVAAVKVLEFLLRFI